MNLWPQTPAFTIASVWAQTGLTLHDYEEFDVKVSMSADEYVRYILGSASVEAAIVGGSDECEIREFCQRTFYPVFDGQARAVSFSVQLAISCKTTPQQPD